MTKNPDTDPKVLSLPNAQPETPRLDIQSAANFMAGVTRLNEILGSSEGEHSAEADSIRRDLGGFVSTHAVNLVQGWLQAAAILAPLQQSLSSIIGPCVAKALHDHAENSKPAKS